MARETAESEEEAEDEDAAEEVLQIQTLTMDKIKDEGAGQFSIQHDETYRVKVDSLEEA